MAREIYSSRDSVPMRIFTGVKNDWQLSMFNEDGSVLDATGYTYYCQVRDSPGGRLLATMTIDATYISTGILSMSLSKANSELIGERSGVYDILQQEDAVPANVTRVYGGDVTIIPVATEVTV